MRIKIFETIQNILKRTRNNKENNIDYENAKMILKNDEDSILVDVRSPQEYKEGHLQGSINIPLYDIEQMAKEKIKNKNATIIVYCQSGARSRKSVQILNKLNYNNIYNIEGGLDKI